MLTQTLINNYQLLDLLGLIEPAGEFVRLSDKALLLKDEGIRIPELPNSMRFPLKALLTKELYTQEELEQALNDLADAYYIKHLRIFLSQFNPDENGIITHRAELWDRFKAWRYDIDIVDKEEFKKDPKGALRKIEAKEKEILALLDKLPLHPNIIKRSNRGIHLFYVFNDFITREDLKTYHERFNTSVKDKGDHPVIDKATVYHLVSDRIPKFLVKSGFELDMGASSKITAIATRFITNELPAYLLHEPYSFKEFITAFEFLKNEVENESKGELIYLTGKKPLTINDLTLETFLSVIGRCPARRMMDENWETHSYDEWFVMFTDYAIKILLARTPEEAEEFRAEYHEKSSRYPRYTEKEAEDKLEDAIKRQKKELIVPSCRHIYTKTKYSHICETCQYRKFDRNGNMIGNFFRDALKEDHLESVFLPGYQLLPDGWYKLEKQDQEGYTPVKIAPYFIIRNYYLVGEDNIELVEIEDKNGISYIVKVDRKKDTYLINIDLIKPFGFINHNKIPDIRKFLTYYVETVKEERMIKIQFLGYKYVNKRWHIAVGGEGNYRRKDLGYLLHQQEINDSWFIPSVQGNVETFKAIYHKAFQLPDSALHLAIAHYLSWIGRQFIDDDALKPELNPVLILVGDAGTGKTQRAKISAGLFGNPAVFSFLNLSQASFNNRFPMIKAPFGIDEVITKSPQEELKLVDWCYNVGNKLGKMTAYNTHDPVDVPIILTGETENFLVDKMFANFRGLNRRSIVVRMTTEWKDNSETLDAILRELRRHYGHILSYVKSLKPEDKAYIEKTAQEILPRLDLKGSSFKDIRIHLALSLAMFKHFFIHFIGFNLEDKEVDKKIGEIISFVIKEINENQLYQIGETIDPIQEILSFISSVNKAIHKNGETFRGMTFKKVKNTIDYKPSHKVEEILKKFFWEKYTSGTTTNLRFRDNSLLFDLPAPTQEDINDNAEKILKDFTTEDFSLWLRVAEVRFGKKGLERIKELLLKSDYRNELQNKFPTLLSPTKTKTISQPQPQPEPEVDF